MLKEQVKNYNLSRLLKQYAYQWVALSSDRRKILASGKTLKEAAAKTEDVKEAILMKVIPHTSFYVPGAL